MSLETLPRLIKTHRLTVSAAAAINRNSFTAKAIGQFIGLIDRCNGSFLREIYGLADCCVTVPLKSCLHPNMPLGLNIVGTFEDFAYFGWDLRDFLNAAGFGNMFFQFFAVKTAFFGYLSENRVYLQHF